MVKPLFRFSWMFAVTALACGSSDNSGSGGTGASANGGASSGGAGAGTSLLAPVIEMVMPMAPAGLHVSWSNTQADCDSVDGERKTLSAAWAQVFTVPGYVDNKHDGTATEKIAYSYRLRCKKGASYSSYSNEMSGTPQ